MKKTTILAACLGIGLPLGLTVGAIDHYQHLPKPEPTVLLSELTTEKQAHANDLEKAGAQLQASNTQLTTVTSQKLSACNAVIKYKVVLEACK